MRFEVVNIVLGVLIGSMVGLGLYTFVYASENSMGFHADQYSVTEFAKAINTCRQGQLALRRDVKSVSVQFPTIPNTQLGQPRQDGK